VTSISPRLMRWLTALGLLALMVAPGPANGVFDGLPWSTRTEAVVAGLLLAVVMVRPWRSAVNQPLGGSSSRLLAVPIVLLLLTVLKVAVWVGNPSAGTFEACYRGALGVPTENQCAVSFENPWLTDPFTRLDADLKFAPQTPVSTGYPGSTWNLGLVNDLPYNLYEPSDSLPELQQFPFRVTCTADANVDSSGVVAFTYTGEGLARLGDLEVELLPVYDGVGRVEAQVTPGRTAVTIEYAFTSIVRVDETPPGPYARFQVDGLRPTGPGLFATAVTVTTDLLVALAAAGALALGLRQARRRALVSLLTGTGATAVVLMVHLASRAGVLPESIRNQISPAAVVGVGLVLVTLVTRPWLALPVGVPVALTVTTVDVMGQVGHLGEVLYRSRGDDWLTYQAFARNMLAGDPLRGAEDVFYYQPGFRYLLYLARLVLGDSDALVAWVQLAGFALVALVLVRMVVRRHSAEIDHWYSAGALVALWSFGFTDWFIEKALDGLSEVPAWIGLLALGGLLLRPVSLRTGMWVALLAASIALIRPNQLPAMAVLVAVYAWMLGRHVQPDRWRRVAATLGVFAALLLLPLAHNVVYGSAFTALPTGANTVEDLPLGRVPDALSDAEVRSVISDKAKGLFHVGGSGFPPGSSVLSPFALMQVLWLSAIVLAAVQLRGRTRLAVLALLAWPFAFAASHVSYDIWIYYPRHVVAFNMSMVVMGLLVLGKRRSAVSGSTAEPLDRRLETST
jgi:hypothetical protein